VAGRLRIPAALQLDSRRLPGRRHERIQLPEGNEPARLDFVIVTEISEGGAKLVAPAPLEVGRTIRLKLPLMEPVRGRIVWISSRLAGCEFVEPLHPAVLRILVAAATVDRKEWRLSLEGGPFRPV